MRGSQRSENSRALGSCITLTLNGLFGGVGNCIGGIYTLIKQTY